jgi:hypothetical protein
MARKKSRLIVAPGAVSAPPRLVVGQLATGPERASASNADADPNARVGTPADNKPRGSPYLGLESADWGPSVFDLVLSDDLLDRERPISPGGDRLCR